MSNERKSILIYSETGTGRRYLTADGSLSSNIDEAAHHWASQFDDVVAENWWLSTWADSPKALDVVVREYQATFGDFIDRFTTGFVRYLTVYAADLPSALRRVKLEAISKGWPIDKLVAVKRMH